MSPEMLDDYSHILIAGIVFAICHLGYLVWDTIKVIKEKRGE